MPTIPERLETATSALEAAVSSFTEATSRVDPTITSYAQLAAVATVSSTVPRLKIWRDSSSGVMCFSVLLAGTDATNTSEGTQRPTDYNASTNAKVWYNS